jgi:hypothetical protein
MSQSQPSTKNHEGALWDGTVTVAKAHAAADNRTLLAVAHGPRAAVMENADQILLALLIIAPAVAILWLRDIVLRRFRRRDSSGVMPAKQPGWLSKWAYRIFACGILALLTMRFVAFCTADEGKHREAVVFGFVYGFWVAVILLVLAAIWLRKRASVASKTVRCPKCQTEAALTPGQIGEVAYTCPQCGEQARWV